VSLLTCQSNRFVDKSVNAFAITVLATPKVTPFSPFPITTAYDPSVNGGAGYFDGSGDYLVSGASTLGSSNFTIEFWLYPLNVSSTSYPIWSTTSGLKADHLAFEIVSGAIKIYITEAGGSVWSIVGGTSMGTLTANAWNHVALVRNGTSWSGYVNGVLGSFNITSSQTVALIDGFSIGAYIAAGYYNGYISGFRQVVGTAVYTGAFTPPTAPLTAITDTELLCNFTNAGILDNTGFNALETVGNAQIDTTTKKYGTGSIEFDGTGDELITPQNPAIAPGGGNFTLECWIYPISNSFFNGIYQNYTDGNGRSTAFRINTNNADQTSLMVQTEASALITTSTGVVTANDWNHIALVRNGGGSNNLVLYVNGVSAGTATNTTNFSDGYAQIGNARYAGTNYYWNGLIDDLRLTVGIARYTTTFTPPTKAFPDIGS
jgi:hypothetical protein